MPSAQRGTRATIGTEKVSEAKVSKVSVFQILTHTFSPFSGLEATWGLASRFGSRLASVAPMAACCAWAADAWDHEDLKSAKRARERERERERQSPFLGRRRRRRSRRRRTERSSLRWGQFSPRDVEEGRAAARAFPLCPKERRKERKTRARERERVNTQQKAKPPKTCRWKHQKHQKSSHGRNPPKHHDENNHHNHHDRHKNHLHYHTHQKARFQYSKGHEENVKNGKINEPKAHYAEAHDYQTNRPP